MANKNAHHEDGEMKPMKKSEDLPDILTPEDVMGFLPIGRNGVYDALRAGDIRSIRVGQKFIITKAAVREFLGGPVE